MLLFSQAHTSSGTGCMWWGGGFNDKSDIGAENRAKLRRHVVPVPAHSTLWKNPLRDVTSRLTRNYDIDATRQKAITASHAFTLLLCNRMCHHASRYCPPGSLR